VNEERISIRETRERTLENCSNCAVPQFFIYFFYYFFWQKEAHVTIKQVLEDNGNDLDYI
jgi:hypothetical protein